MPDNAATKDGTAPILLAGDDGLAVRVREELAAMGVPVVAICTQPAALAARAAIVAGARVVVGDIAEPGTWAEAGIGEAAAVGLLGPSDVGNLHAALLVEELHDEGPVVVRMHHSDRDGGLEGLLGERGRILSDAEVAAPAFLHAALLGNTGQRITVAGRPLEVAEVDATDPALLVALCNADTPTDVLPEGEDLGDRVLGLIDPYAASSARGTLPVAVQQAAERRAAQRGDARARRTRRLRRVRGLAAYVPRRAVILVAVMLLVMLVSATIFNFGTTVKIDELDAIYFTVTTMATVGYGDVNLIGQPDWVKVYDIFLMAFSAVLVGIFLATITESLVTTRIDQALGRFPRPTRDHVVVCGLGRAGTEVLVRLHDAGVPCIGIEQSAEAAGLTIARALEIPVIVGDARNPGTLEDLNLGRARALMALTTDDLANLQCALKARELNPDLRVVLRCFDQQLAERLDKTIEMDLTRSVADLAAPPFAAALLGRSLAEALPISNVPLRLLETTVPVGSSLDGNTVGAVEADGRLRFLHCDHRWRPRDDFPISAGEPIAVVGTREACDALLRA
ncbi:MAG: potassium channel family protein [Solirubrobacteraceae bacterium]|nr:potassium channel family protein [Solirubrobacteraceae bacterium]